MIIKSDYFAYNIENWKSILIEDSCLYIDEYQYRITARVYDSSNNTSTFFEDRVIKYIFDLIINKKIKTLKINGLKTSRLAYSWYSEQAMHSKYPLLTYEEFKKSVDLDCRLARA